MALFSMKLPFRFYIGCHGNIDISRDTINRKRVTFHCNCIFSAQILWIFTMTQEMLVTIATQWNQYIVKAFSGTLRTWH